MKIACIGCGTPSDDIFCDECRPSTQSHYTTAEWKRIRAAFISRHPFCIDCERKAQVADHFPISRYALVARGVENPDDDEHLVPRCVACHDARLSTRRGRTIITNDIA